MVQRGCACDDAGPMPWTGLSDGRAGVACARARDALWNRPCPCGNSPQVASAGHGGTHARAPRCPASSSAHVAHGHGGIRAGHARVCAWVPGHARVRLQVWITEQRDAHAYMAGHSRLACDGPTSSSRVPMRGQRASHARAPETNSWLQRYSALRRRVLGRGYSDTRAWADRVSALGSTALPHERRAARAQVGKYARLRLSDAPGHLRDGPERARRVHSPARSICFAGVRASHPARHGRA